MKKLLLCIIMSMFLISFASAWFPSAGINPEIKNNLTITPSADKYPAVEIKDWLGLGSTIWEGVLTDHTESCGNKCLSIAYTKLYNEGTLFDEVRFYTVTDKEEFEQAIRSYQFYIKTGEHSIDVPDYEWKCVNVGLELNGSIRQSCSSVLTGSHKEIIPEWKPYNIGDILPAGEYYWKLEGEKRPDRTVDWQIKTNGEWISDWAVWGIANVTNAHDLTMVGGGTAANNDLGANITMNIGLTNANLYVNISGTNIDGTHCRLRNSSYGIIANGTIINPYCIIHGANLTAGKKYTIGMFNSAGAINPNLSAQTATGFPINQSYVNWTGGYYDNAGVPLNAGAIVMIRGITFEITSSTINQEYPVDYYNSSSQNVNLNCSVIMQSATVKNISLLNNVSGTFLLNQTNDVTGTVNSTLFTKSFPDGSYLWGCSATDSDNSIGYSTNRTFMIDTIAPTISISSPTNLITYGKNLLNVSLNYSINELHLSSCWYNYNGTNITTLCNANSSFLLDSTTKSLTLYANDTVGNVNSLTRVWNYTIFENSQSYNSTTYETADEGFTLNATGMTSASLNYDSTLYPVAVSDGYASKLLDIPLVNDVTNKTFYWIINSAYNSSFFNQTVNPTFFNLCNSTNNVTYINFTFKDESTLSKINSTIVSSLFTSYLGSGTVNRTLSFSNSSDNPSYGFCFSPSFKAVNLNYNLRYSTSGYPQRAYSNYNLLNNITTNKTLYLLSNLLGQSVSFQILNSAGQSLTGAEVIVNTTISGSSVEISRTNADSSGIAGFFLNPSTSYSILATYPGLPSSLLTITPTLTQYTIILGASATTNTTATQTGLGLTLSILPKDNQMYNDTNYNLNLTINSTYWAMSSWGYTIVTDNGTILDTKSSTSASGGVLNSNINSNSYSSIYMNYFYIINGNTQTGSFWWKVISTSESQWSISSFITDLKSYLNINSSGVQSSPGIFGLTAWGLNLIIFLFIFITTGVLTYKFGITSPAAIMITLWSMIFIFDVGLGLILNPLPTAAPHVPTVLFGIICIAMIIREYLY